MYYSECACDSYVGRLCVVCADWQSLPLRLQCIIAAMSVNLKPSQHATCGFACSVHFPRQKLKEGEIRWKDAVQVQTEVLDGIRAFVKGGDVLRHLRAAKTKEKIQVFKRRIETQAAWATRVLPPSSARLPFVYLYSGMDLINAAGLAPSAPSITLAAEHPIYWRQGNGSRSVSRCRLRLPSRQ